MDNQLETQGATAGEGKLAATRNFFVATRGEMDKVSWPAREELIKATRAVIIGSMVLGVVIGLVDWMLQKILVNGVALIAR